MSTEDIDSKAEAQTVAATTDAAPARTIATLVLAAAARYTGPAMRSPEGDKWVRTSYPELGRDIRAIAKGLIALGVDAGDRVAILSNTRAEWTLADFATVCTGATVVPVYQTNSPEECEYVLDHSGATALFCEDEEQLAKLAGIRSALPQLTHVFRFEGDGDDGVMTLDAVRAAGADVSDDDLDARIAGIGSDDVATIVYTSGTTGPPKGCMLTHGNLCADIDGIHQILQITPDEDVLYVFLPLAHVLTRIVQLFAIDAGGEMAYWRRDPKKIVEDVQLIKPTYLPSVPRIFEKIHTAATAKADAAGGAKAKIFHWAVGVGREVARREDRGGHPGLVLKAQHGLADKLVLHKIRDLFGGRVKLALSGAAPIDTEILEFFHAAGVWVLEGYGMTETCAVETLNTIEHHRFGTVGRPLPVCEVKIADDGEVLMRGPNIFKGYYNNPEATADTLNADGWLHSGDLGELDTDGYLSITGRKKDLIITSSGKNISPSNIENALKLCRWISQAVVFGDRKPYLAALLTIDPDECKALAEKVGASSHDAADLANDPAVRKELQGAVDAANQKFARIEQVKKFTVLERDLSQEHEELTPTLKVKRNVVYERYKDEFEALYASAGPTPG